MKERKKKWWLIGGVIGFFYSLVGILFTIASATVGYDCPIKIKSFVDIFFYPVISTSCLLFFREKGFIGLLTFSILNLVIFSIIGGAIGKLFQTKK